MPNYYVNTRAQANGHHEVHTVDCFYLPSPRHQKYLGFFATCRDAVVEARNHYPRSNGCYYCSRSCHTS